MVEAIAVHLYGPKNNSKLFQGTLAIEAKYGYATDAPAEPTRCSSANIIHHDTEETTSICIYHSDLQLFSIIIL